jgi:uncharacterized membrane protein YhaH (DUF805 family)
MTHVHDFGPEASSLIAKLHDTDTPYAAWAAIALSRSPDARYRAVGRNLAIRLRDQMPARDVDLEHAHLAGYAMLATEYLTAEQRTRIADALPAPHAQLASRSRFYSSPLYVYLSTRGLAADLPDPQRLAQFVSEDASATADHPGTDVPDLALRLATVFELASVLSIPTRLLRAFHARLVTSEDNAQAAIAVHWLLARYANMWSSSDEAVALHHAAVQFVEAHCPATVIVDTLSLKASAMRLETVALRANDYVLVTQETVRQAVSGRLGQQRIMASLAYAFSFAVLAAAPIWFVSRGRLPPGVGVAASAGLWIPATLWAVLIAYGRRRHDRALGGAVALAMCYYVFAIYAAATGSASLLTIASTDALLTLIPVVVTTVIGALPARRG